MYKSSNKVSQVSGISNCCVMLRMPSISILHIELLAYFVVFKNGYAITDGSPFGYVA
jgi:hypothetical protein